MLSLETELPEFNESLGMASVHWLSFGGSFFSISILQVAQNFCANEG
jgi:hypothetical protein